MARTASSANRTHVNCLAGVFTCARDRVSKSQSRFLRDDFGALRDVSIGEGSVRRGLQKSIIQIAAQQAHHSERDPEGRQYGASSPGLKPSSSRQVRHFNEPTRLYFLQHKTSVQGMTGEIFVISLPWLSPLEFRCALKTHNRCQSVPYGLYAICKISIWVRFLYVLRPRPALLHGSVVGGEEWTV